MAGLVCQVVERGGVRVAGIARWASKRCQVVEGGGVQAAGIARWASKRCQVVEGGGVQVAGIARWASKRCQVVEGGGVQVAGIARDLSNGPTNPGGIRRATGGLAALGWECLCYNVRRARAGRQGFLRRLPLPNPRRMDPRPRDGNTDLSDA